MDPSDLTSPALYINRELSWLEFNRRVLAQAQDVAHPLLERVKFLAIAGTNLDEFFMVRVATILKKFRAGIEETSFDGLSTEEELGLIRSRELGDAVALALGQRHAMLLRGHGANVAWADVRSATVNACLLEEAADLQLRALAAVGGNAERLMAFSAEETAHVRAEFDAAGPRTRAWEYYAALTEDRL